MNIMTGEHYRQLGVDRYQKITVSRSGAFVEIKSAVYDDFAAIRAEETHRFLEEQIVSFTVTDAYIDVAVANGDRHRI